MRIYMFNGNCIESFLGFFLAFTNVILKNIEGVGIM